MTSEISNPRSAIRNRRWWLVTLEVLPCHQEEVSSLLFDLGSIGILTMEETQQRVKLGAYFEATRAPDAIKRSVQAVVSDYPFLITVTQVAEQDWLQKWKEGFEAIPIGERLLISPSWKRPNKPEGRVVIQIDPGMAFGTGTHETTRLCLEALDRCWRGGSLLDVGTGTGILAIAAALLAPNSRIVAIDIDPQAVCVARDNVAINGVAASIELLEGQPASLADETFDLVVANLTAEVIISLMNDLASRVAAGGLMIVSGILREFADDVERSLGDSGFHVTERCDAAEWCAIIARSI